MEHTLVADFSTDTCTGSPDAPNALPAGGPNSPLEAARWLSGPRRPVGSVWLRPTPTFARRVTLPCVRVQCSCHVAPPDCDRC